MSKIGVISDIHGNFPALVSVIRELHKKKCEKIICLGDISGFYSMINECIDLLIRENVFCLKGNHDSYIIGESSCPRSRSVMECIRYQQKVIETEYLEWIRKLEPVYLCEAFYAMHGGFDDPLDEYISEFDFNKARKIFPQFNIFFSGHTHKQTLQTEGGLVYCNPGSVGQPRDCDCRAAYAILENGKVSIERVEYDIDMISRHMQESGFSDYYYRNLYEGKKIGE